MINVSHLVKHFGSTHAVNDITFHVEKGEVLGFLGPNGAGKSTTMRIITGFIPPTSGSATVCGDDIITRPVAARRHIGYLPENAPVYPDMTVESYLYFIADIRGYVGRDKKDRVEYAISTCALESVRHKSVDSLSKGFKQRACFAQAILHDPPVLIMDEPTDGLDPNQKHEVRTLISSMSKDKCIILSTHILEEVDAVCSRAIIIAEGKIVANGTPDQLRSSALHHGAVLLSLSGVEEAKVIPFLKGLPNVADAERYGTQADAVVYRVLPQKGLQISHHISAAVREKRWALEEFHIERGKLDDVFREVTRGDTAIDSSDTHHKAHKAV